MFHVNLFKMVQGCSKFYKVLGFRFQVVHSPCLNKVDIIKNNIKKENEKTSRCML